MHVGALLDTGTKPRDDLRSPNLSREELVSVASQVPAL